MPILTSNQGRALIERITNYCRAHDLLRPRSCIVVGLSGGPDSVFLLHVLVLLREQLQLTLIAAHLDHGWRENSSEDALFCAQLAKALGVLFEQEHAHNLVKNLEGATRPTGSLEEQGRALRRAFFKRVAGEHQADLIALAHHQDDQHETFFIRLMRGTTLAGLAGIRPRAKKYIHPLLCCTKQEILEFLHEHQITYRLDATNSDQKFLRNRIRAQVLPVLQACDNRSQASLTSAIEHLQETDIYLEELTGKLLDAITQPNEGKNWINWETLFVQHPYMQKRLVLNWLIRAGVPFTPSRALLEEILKFLRTGQGGTHSLAQSWHIVKKKCYAGIALKSGH